METAMDDLIPPDELVAANGIGIGKFREIGEGLVSRYQRLGLLTPNDTVVDIGCGLGRVARPMTALLTGGRYYGFDINKSSIDWCKEKYARFHNFKFEWMDLHSIFYNKGGEKRSKDFEFPVADNMADFINLTSVFTHMFVDDVAGYMKEIGRMLRPGRRCFITYFLIEDSIDKEFLKKYHPVQSGLIRDKDCPETMVLLDQQAVIDLYEASGMKIEKIAYGSWAGNARKNRVEVGYQDEIIARKV